MDWVNDLDGEVVGVDACGHGDSSLAEKCKDILLGARNLETLPLSPNVAVEAARLRAEHNLRTPDAVQLATAKSADASHFSTSDSRFPTLPGLRIIVVDELLEEPVS